MLGWIKYLRRVRVETDALKRNKNFVSTRTLLSLVRDERIAGSNPATPTSFLRIWGVVRSSNLFGRAKIPTDYQTFLSCGALSATVDKRMERRQSPETGAQSPEILPNSF